MQAEKVACRKIVLRDLFRGPFHTASQCESGTVYGARRLFQVLPLRPVLYSRLLVAVNAKSFLREFCIKGPPAVEEKPSIHVTYTVKHLLSFTKQSSGRGGCSQPEQAPTHAQRSLLQKEVKDSNVQFVCSRSSFCPFLFGPAPS